MKAKACIGMNNFHTSYRNLFLPFIPMQNECILQSCGEEIFRLCMATASQELPTKVQCIRLYTTLPRLCDADACRQGRERGGHW